MKKAFGCLVALILMLICLGAAAEEVQSEPIIYYGSLKSERQLAADYINRQMHHVAERGDTAGNRLFGVSRLMYDDLKAQIIKIASGELLSTQIDLDPEPYYGDTVFPSMDAANQQLTDDLFPAIDALILDLPYELYWYDKTIGSYICFDARTYNGKYLMLNINVNMRVSSSYAVGTYSINSKYSQGVQNAVSNAAAIVRNHASESDRAKLTSYKNEICSLVSYNNSAASGGSYGDPWQIIWVFDGDSSTNVVCEGYAKAFQYLCDCSTFQSSRIKALSATGVMSSTSGSGNHMWNVVMMENGLRYLVDVTNCDSGTVGASDKLFLVGYTSGSYDAGYTYVANGINVTYKYDDLAAVLGMENLLMATVDNQQPETPPPATPTPTPMPVKTPVPTAVPTVTPTPEPTPDYLQEDSVRQVAPGDVVNVPLDNSDHLHFDYTIQYPMDVISYFSSTEGCILEDGWHADEIVIHIENTRKEIATVSLRVNANAAPGTYVIRVSDEWTGDRAHSYSVQVVGSAAPTAAPVTTVTTGAGTFTIKNGTATFTKPANKNAKKLTIPSTVKDNTGKSVKVTAIAAKACKGMTKLTTLTIGKNVKTIGKQAFYGCKKLKTITIKTKLLTSSSVKSQAFKGIYKKATIKCPSGKKSAYKKWLTKKGVPKTATIK